MSEKEAHDEIMFGPEISPGAHVALRRSPDGSTRRVICSRQRDGVPLAPSAELIDIGRASEDGWRRVTVLYKGPPQVATPAYREGWIFGKKSTVGQA